VSRSLCARPIPLSIAFASIHCQCGACRRFPQSCPGSFVRIGSNPTTNQLGSCEPPPVPPLPTCASEAAPSRCARVSVGLLQVPSFDVKAVSSALSMVAKKTAANASVAFEVLLIASNVNGPGGIGSGWHEGGLSANSHVNCSDGPPAPCTTANCSSIWISPCSIASHVLIDIIAIDPSNSAANMGFEVFPRDLPAGVYNLTVYVPAKNSSNGTSWSYFDITGHFTVVAVADSALSELSACQGNDRCVNSSAVSMATPISFKSAPSAAVVISILPKDINGIAILRAGEDITVLLTKRAVSSAGVSRTVPLATSFNSKSMQYEAVVPAADMAVEGNYTVTLQTLVTTNSPRSLVFAVECASGYIANDRTRECEPSNRCTGDDQYVDAKTLTCKQKPAMAVSGSSTVVSIRVRKTNRTKAESGTAEVRLTSGDVDPGAPVHWAAAVPLQDASWLSCNLLNGTVDGKSPASRFQLSVDASGLNGTLSSSINVTSTIGSFSSNGSVMFVQGTDKLHLPVSVSVLAITYLRKEDVAISFKVDQTPVSLSSIPAGTSLRVAVETRDCDRLIVDRPDQQLRLVLSSSLGGYAPQKVALVYKECDRCAGLFEAELSGTWLSDPGTYVLEVRSEDSEDPSVVTLSFDTFDPSRAQIAQGAVVGTLGACIIAGMCFMIYRNPKRAKQLLLSFVTTEFKMLFTTTSEVWDIVGARPLLKGQRYVGFKC
jgi:hypothetical protein